jgi:transposase-like protein
MGKIYPEEVKKKAVQLYRLDDKTIYAEVGRDLGGISGETVRNWVRRRPGLPGRGGAAQALQLDGPARAREREGRRLQRRALPGRGRRLRSARCR